MRPLPVQSATGAPGGRRTHRPLAASAVPHQRIFQDRVGYGHGCPWSCREPSPVEYRIGDYPEAERFLASHLYVFGINPPNGPALMERYAEAFHKVLANAVSLLA